MTKTLLSILTAALVTYLVRVLPLTLIRKPIRSRFLRSFLYYVPYVTLAVMTFPAIVQATEQPIAGAAALVARRRTDHRGGLVLRRGVRRGASARTSLSFPTKAVAFLRVYAMITARCSIGKRLPQGGFSYAEMQIDRPAGFSAEAIIRLHLFSPTPWRRGVLHKCTTILQNLPLEIRSIS